MKLKKSNCLALFLILILILSSFSSCKKSSEVPIEDYFNYLRKTQYERIYTMLSDDSKDDISLDDLVNRYTNIYSAMSITSMTYDVVTTEYTDTACHIFFILNITSQKLDEFKLNMTAIFIKDSNGWKLKWSPSLLLPGMDDEDVARITSTAADRGEIFAADGSLLAQNAIATSVYVNIDKIQNDESLIRVLAPIIDMEETDIREKLKPYYEKLQEAQEDTNDDTAEEYSSVSNLVVLKAFSKDNGLTQAEIDTLLEIDGIGIDTDFMTKYRYYPNGSIMAHTIGYVGVMTEDEAALSENISLPADTMIGKSGLEKKYEMYLRAKPGYKLSILDKYGHEKAVVAQREGQDGSDLRLNIDFDLQMEAELMLMQKLTDEMAGAVVVLDPTNGDVLTVASFPTFDPNLFAFSMSTEDWQYLNDPENRNPLYNRALQGLYPPGSTFKPFTAAMAIDTDSINRNFVFTEKIDDNVWTPSDPEWVYPGIKRFARTPGNLNMENAITYSDNIYFAYVAMQIGRTTFYDYCERYGFNDSIPFDLDIPSAKISNSDKIEDIKQLADSGYGQGELLITPLQMASAFASFANGGDILIPRLINSINVVTDHKYYVQQEYEPAIWRDDIISSYAIDILAPYLKRVITHGTGTKAYVSGMSIYGKTGTAEIGNDKAREIAWFIGYTKGENAKLVCVMVEVPEGQGDIKLEIAKELFK